MWLAAIPFPNFVIWHDFNEDEKKGGLSELAAFLTWNWCRQNNIENEIEILKSRTLVKVRYVK
jgi:hypothetical protein